MDNYALLQFSSVDANDILDRSSLRGLNIEVCSLRGQQAVGESEFSDRVGRFKDDASKRVSVEEPIAGYDAVMVFGTHSLITV